MIHPSIKMLLAGGLALGLGSVAGAQTPLGAPGGAPLMSYNRPYAFSGSNYVLPRTGGFASGDFTSGQPYVYYGANNYVPRIGPYAYKPTYSYRPGVTTYNNRGYYAALPRTTSFRAFIPSVTAPGTRYYLPGTVTYGVYRTPNTVTYGAPTPGGYATYIDPSYRGYVMPRANLVRYYVR